MGFPNNVLSDVAFHYTWRGLDVVDPTDTIDYEMGAKGLDDPTYGLEYQLWTFDTDQTSVYASAPTVNRQVILTPGVPVDSIRCCFDQNMRPFVAYLSKGQWSYWWYDTTIPGPTTTQLPPTVDSVVCTLDEKRPWENGISDICLLYTNNNNLYYRRQRDRYGVEYLLRASINGTLVKAGMNGINRVQLKLRAKLL